MSNGIVLKTLLNLDARKNVWNLFEVHHIDVTFSQMELREACKSNPEAVEKLLDDGANPYSKDELGNTALHIAAKHNPQLVHLFELRDIPNKLMQVPGHFSEHFVVNPNVRDLWGNTPLHIGCLYFWNVERLLDMGALAHAKNAFGDTPLHNAYRVKFMTAIRLLPKSEELNLLGETPIELWTS